MCVCVRACARVCVCVCVCVFREYVFLSVSFLFFLACVVFFIGEEKIVCWLHHITFDDYLLRFLSQLASLTKQIVINIMFRPAVTSAVTCIC